jgi:hypothetical protein
MGTRYHAIRFRRLRSSFLTRRWRAERRHPRGNRNCDICFRTFPAAAASIFSLTYLGLTARDLPKLTPEYLRKHAADENAPP